MQAKNFIDFPGAIFPAFDPDAVENSRDGRESGTFGCMHMVHRGKLGESTFFRYVVRFSTGATYPDLKFYGGGTAGGRIREKKKGLAMVKGVFLRPQIPGQFISF